MTQEQFRIEIQTNVENWLNGFMQQNNIPAAMMEDAINKALVGIKEKVLQEFIMAASQPAQPQEEVKEEDSGEK